MGSLFSESAHTTSCVQKQPRTGFEGMKGSWRAAEAWPWERPGEATCEGVARVAVEAPGSWRNIDVWHHEEGISKSTVQLQYKTLHLKTSVPWDDGQEQPQPRSGSSLSLKDKLGCSVESEK